MSARGEFYGYRDKDGMGFSDGKFFSLGSSSPSTPSPDNTGVLLDNESEETYRIVTVCFDHEGNELAPVGILPIYDTGCPFPTFGIVKPAVTNTRVDMSPYGQSVFADATRALPSSGITGSQCFHSCRALVGGNGTAWSSSNVGYTYMRIDRVGQTGYLTAA